MKSKKSFTLIEVSIVIAIIILIGTIIFAKVKDIREKGRINLGKQFDQTIQNVTGESKVGEWKFEKIEGNITPDSSGYGNDGEAHGSPNLVSGIDGNALEFDGSNDYIAIKNLHYENPNEIKELTVTAWVKIPLDGGDWSILDFDRSEYFTCAAGIPNTSYVGEGDYVGFHTSASGHGIKDMWSNKKVRDGKWHFIVWVFDSNEIFDKKIYIDGELDAQQDAYPTGVGLGTGNKRYGFIGDGSEASSFNGSRNNKYFEGVIDEVRIYHKALKVGEIRKIYAETIGKVVKK